MTRSGEEVCELSDSFAELPDPPSSPTECPDCGSRSIICILYGFLGPEGLDLAQRGEIAWGGCDFRFGGPNWLCKDCYNRWPEEPPQEGSYGEPGKQKKYLAETAAEYASLAVNAALPPKSDEPAVENYWQRADGRRVFLLRFPWGRMRIEKRSHLVPLGGGPLYESVGGLPPAGVDSAKARFQAALAAVRFERRPSS
jgi:hypothetical protein